ncbi:transglycosylase SLT domain-containing protein [Rhodovibrionaceae bacterium A322]
MLLPISFRTVFLPLLALFAVMFVLAQNAQAEEDLHDLVVPEPWIGDMDGMIERRQIRVLTVVAKGQYFLDGARQRGIVYDMFKEFEKSINKKYRKKISQENNTKSLRIEVIFIPVRRDQLISGLRDGIGDIAAANLTITPDRLEEVDFTNPLGKGVKELLVTGPTAPDIKTLDDLAGETILVRPSSSYYQSLLALNARFKEEGKKEVNLTEADEYLQDEDLLEMANAGLIPLVIVDSHKAELWGAVFENLKIHEDIYVRDGAEIGWAIRKDSPLLAEDLNAFVKENKEGTLLGNILIKRYYKNTTWAKNALAKGERDKFEDMAELFQKYGDQYDFDWLMVIAQGYQESGLDQSVRSSAGAIGVMQLLQSTAEDPNVGISDIDVVESNIHAGTKYLRHIRNTYLDDPEIDEVNQTLFSFAAYNAGPSRLRSLRKKAAKAGLDPNLWFQNVEIIAAREIGRETVQYVANIYKYYVAYRLYEEHEKKKAALKQSAE